MQEYEKIETVFERAMDGSKKLIPGKFRNNTVEYLKNNRWIFTEKIDGTNIRIHWDGHKVEFGGRTNNAQIPTPLVNRLNDLFGGNENEEVFEQKFGSKDVILFGEGYGPKINKGHLYRDNVDFILFDVMIDGTYLERHNVEDIAKSFGVDVVPIIIGGGTLEEGIAFVQTNPKSTFGTANMEGLVARPEVEMKDRLGKRVIVKIKVRDHANI